MGSSFILADGLNSQTSLIKPAPNIKPQRLGRPRFEKPGTNASIDYVRPTESGQDLSSILSPGPVKAMLDIGGTTSVGRRLVLLYRLALEHLPHRVCFVHSREASVALRIMYLQTRYRSRISTVDESIFKIHISS